MDEMIVHGFLDTRSCRYKQALLLLLLLMRSAPDILGIFGYSKLRDIVGWEIQDFISSEFPDADTSII